MRAYLGRRQQQESGETTYAIHEVYYDDHGKPEGCTEESVAPMGESIAELQEDLAHYHQALKKPILLYDGLQEVKALDDGSRTICKE